MKSNKLTYQILSGVILLFLFSCKADNVKINSVGIKMIKIPAGSFMMGSNSGQWDEVPVHKVNISEPFFISKTEITTKQFEEFEKDHRFSDEKYAIGVSWYEANEFCKWLSKKEGKNYRLPTEAEWEYVCRNRDEFGAENMLDSTIEWCYDWYGPYIDGSQSDPVGVNTSIAKVVRGGLPDIFIKEYSHPEKFYYRPANRSGIAPTFDGFTVPVKNIASVPSTKKNTDNFPGLTGIVYDDLKMTKTLMLFPIPSVNSSSGKWVTMNNWTAKWQGFIQVPETADYHFITKTDNKLSVEIDGKAIINGNGKDRTLSGSIRLEADKKYPVKIKYLHDGGKSFLQLFWNWNEHKKEIIPAKMFSYSQEEKNDSELEYKKGIFARYVKPSIGFRVVQAHELKSKPVNNEIPFVRQCVKKTLTLPNSVEKKPYFRKRFLHPIPPDNSSKEEIKLAGLNPSLGGHNHHSSIAACPNGDLLAVYFSSVYEGDPEVLLMGSRLRYGADEWDMPTPIIDFPDVNDTSPLLWVDQNKIYLFWGNEHLKGGFPFQWVESIDNGATFSEVKFPNIKSVIDGFTPQPITSIFKDKDGTIYLACDGIAAHSLLWASKDGMKTWFDTGGRTGGRHTAIVPLKNGTFFGVGGKESDINGFMPISISKDKGKSWKISKSIFPSLGDGQRPALIRLKSDALLYAGDFQRKDGFQPSGITKRGSFVALSNDEGKTWKIKKLPGTLESSTEEIAEEMKGETIGYVSVTQSADGMIHLITSKNSPALHFEFNETWILSPAKKTSDSYLMKSTAHKIINRKNYSEKYPNGNIRVKYSAGVADNGKFLLNGKEEWFYKNGSKKYEADFKLGKKVGSEKYFSQNGKILWERNFRSQNKFTWLRYWRNGKLRSESHWVDFRCSGIANYFDNKGTLVKEATFVNGRIIK